MVFFVLIKRKGSKNWAGVVPARKGVTLSQLNKVIPKTIKKGFTFKIVTSQQLKKSLPRLIPSKIRKRAKKRKRIRMKRRKRRRVTKKKR